jgi:hypothetical protein
MHLAVERELVVGEADFGAHAATVLLNPLGIVTGARSEVERLVHTLAHAPDTSRERD